MRNEQAKYGKDLSTTTGIRLTETLRDQPKKAAKFQGMSFSQFLRQSLNRNIELAKTIEKEVALKHFQAASKRRD